MTDLNDNWRADAIDVRIMQMRALGYKQVDIAEVVNISQSAISQRLENINQKARKAGEPSKFFWTALIGVIGFAIIETALNKM
jgi:transcriptional regulator